MSYKIVLPTLDEANKRHDVFDATPLDEFIHNCQPPGEVRARIFRDLLEQALQYAIDEQESFGLTLDGAEKRIQDTICECSAYYGADDFPADRCPKCGGTYPS